SIETSDFDRRLQLVEDSFKARPAASAASRWPGSTQLKEEILLQICCRFDGDRLPMQFSIAAGGERGRRRGETPAALASALRLARHGRLVQRFDVGVRVALEN